MLGLNNLYPPHCFCEYHHHHDHYDHNPHLPNTDYPSSGPMYENEFMLVNGVPYIIDNSNVVYGTRINVADAVYTRFTQRRDDACIDLAATIDLTKTMNTNTVLNHFIEQIILNDYKSLEGVLKIMKSTVTFRLSFSVKDVSGATVFSGSEIVTTDDIIYHATDIEDYFLTTASKIFIINIPQLTYQGLYTLSIDKFEAYVPTINTLSKLTDGLNPFYQFDNNNTKVVIQHDIIDAETDTSDVIIASANINYQTQFQANLTTRLKVSFTTFMSEFISTFNTFEIWNNLNNVDTPKIADLETKVKTLEETVADLTNRVIILESIKPTVKYAKNTSYATGQLVWLTPGKLYQVLETFISDNDEAKTVIESMEADITASKLVLINE